MIATDTNMGLWLQRRKPSHAIPALEMRLDLLENN
jgi:hypothetical protein